MDDQQESLVKLVAREVIEVLTNRGMIDPEPSDTTNPPAQIRSPMGTCTGDYSKFPELRSRLSGSNPKSSLSADSADAAAESDRGEESRLALPGGQSSAPTLDFIPLTGIITAKQLQEAMDAASDGVAVIAAGARLTPLANDLSRQKPQSMRQLTAMDTTQGTSTPESTPWLWWIDGQCPAVAQLTQARSAKLRAAASGPNPEALSQVVRDVAGSLRSGSIAGALLFVRNASRSMCFANRCTSIRAIIGTCGEAVEQGIAELGANVLVIEYPHVGPRAMAAMVDRILQQRPRVTTQVQRELADLTRSG